MVSIAITAGTAFSVISSTFQIQFMKTVVLGVIAFLTACNYSNRNSSEIKDLTPSNAETTSVNKATQIAAGSDTVISVSF